MFGQAQPAILTFPLERVVFLRERGTDTYGTIPYFASKLLVEMPVVLFMSFVSMLIAYWALSLGGEWKEHGVSGMSIDPLTD